MEEIYKPKTTEANKIEIYNRENSDILGDMPNWLIHTGSYIVYAIIGLLLLGTAIFKYPDVVKSDINIDDMGNVDWITANKSGKIDRFFVANESEVRQNDTLGILKNAASITDVKKFCLVLADVEEYYRTNDINYLKNYPFNLIMGEMTDAYEQFTQAVRTNLMCQEFDVFPQKEKFLIEELNILQKNKDVDQISVLKVKRQLFELEIDHKMELGKNKRLLELAYENMVNSLKTWEANYLIKSTSEGTVIWGKSWSMGNLVKEGDTICTVMSRHRGELVGHIRLSQDEVASIASGDKVNIELAKYRAHTYGYLLGEVFSISYVPYNKSYAVEVKLPNGLMTTNRKRIVYEIGLSGKAEIVTSSKSVLDRIFEPIYQLFNKK